MFYGAGAVIWLGLTAYCVFDLSATDESLVRNLPKLMWVWVILFMPIIGSVAWLALGRPVNASFTPGSTQPRPRSTYQRPPSLPPAGPGPEDSPEFMTDLEERRLAAWERDLRRREDELRRKQQDES